MRIESGELTVENGSWNTVGCHPDAGGNLAAKLTPNNYRVENWKTYLMFNAIYWQQTTDNRQPIWEVLNTKN